MRHPLQADCVKAAQRLPYHQIRSDFIEPGCNLPEGNVRVNVVRPHDHIRHDPIRKTFPKIRLEYGGNPAVNAASHPVNVEYAEFSHFCHLLSPAKLHINVSSSK